MQSLPFTALAYTLAAAGAQAQETAAPPTVQIRASADLLRREDSASRSTILREEILRHGDRSALDVLKRLPGVTIRDNTVSMRGLGAGYTQLLLNGERAPANFALDTLAPEMIEKIEVQRAATAEYSTQAIAGSVNIVLRKSVSAAARELKASLGGPHGMLRPTLNLSLSDKADSLSYLLGAEISRNARRDLASNREQASAVDRDPVLRQGWSDTRYRFDGLSLNARLNWKPDQDNTLSWQNFADLRRSQGEGKEGVASLGGAPYPYARLDVLTWIRYRNLRSELAWNRRLGDGAKLDTTLSATETDLRPRMERLAANAAGAAVLARDYRTRTRERSLAWSGKYSQPLGGAHALALGWEAGYGQLRNAEEQDEAPLPGSTPANFARQSDVGSQRLALYAQDEWTIREGWSAYFGLRWEGMRLRSENSGEAATVRSRSATLSPLLHTLWKVPGSQGSQLRLALTRSYKAPRLNQLAVRQFQTIYNSQLTPDFGGNPGLKPERAWGLDAAFEHYWAEGALFSLSASTRRIDGLIADTLRFDGARWLQTPENRGGARVHSLELENKLPLRLLWAEGPPLALRLALNRYWSRTAYLPGPDNRVNQQIPWSATLGADYKGAVWSGGASLALAGGGWTRRTLYDSVYGSVRRDLDAYLVYRVDARQQWRLSLRNLLQPEAQRISRYAAPGSSQRNDEIRPSQREARLQYESRF